MFLKKIFGKMKSLLVKEDKPQTDEMTSAHSSQNQQTNKTNQPNVAAEETIDLRELFLLFYRKKKLFVAVVGACVAVGFVLSLMHHNTFLFSQEIKLGGYYFDSEFVALQQPKKVLFLLDTLYKAAAVRSINKKYNVKLKDSDFQINAMKDNEFLSLSYNGSEQYRAAYKELFQYMLTKLNKAEDEQLRIAHSYFVSSINKEKAQVNTEHDFSSMLNDEIKSLEKNIVAINKQSPSFSPDLMKNKQKTYNKGYGDSGVIDSAMLLSSFNKPSQEPLHKSKLDVIDKVYNSLKQKDSFSAKIYQFNGALKSLRKSTFVGPMWTSDHFWGVTRSSIMTLSLLLGLILGFVVLLFTGIMEGTLSHRKQS